MPNSADSMSSDGMQAAKSDFLKSLSAHVGVSFMFFTVIPATLMLFDPSFLKLFDPVAPQRWLAELPADLIAAYREWALSPQMAFTVLAILAAVVISLSLGMPAEPTNIFNYERAIFNYQVKVFLLNACGLLSSFVVLLVAAHWMTAKDDSATGSVEYMLAIFVSLIILLLTIVRVRREDLEVANMTRILGKTVKNLEKSISRWESRWKNSMLAENCLSRTPRKSLPTHLVKIFLLCVGVWVADALAIYFVWLGYGRNIPDLSAYAGFQWSVLVFVVPMVGISLAVDYWRNYPVEMDGSMSPILKSVNIIGMLFILLVCLLSVVVPFSFIYGQIVALNGEILPNVTWLVPFLFACMMAPAFFVYGPRLRFSIWHILHDAFWDYEEGLELRRRARIRKSIEAIQQDLEIGRVPPQGDGLPFPTENVGGNALVTSEKGLIFSRAAAVLGLMGGASLTFASVWLSLRKNGPRA
ncbi:lysylphosphatidylglycerol synthase domain-containing protein [Kocuria sp. WN036]|uniref:lysylphosphatidylglycerol synthase domain-containing protein n=1 Tax=Kocuria sp. WN036 TaxID=2032628 RepID=UPI0015957EEB|nr:lysylphosphatidylglycerol synthase domain-containing protein [Kocuria sp. WN036]